MEIKMKHEEAYDLIESCLEYDKDMSEYPERYEMALQIAREVFQKQIPKKPLEQRYVNYEIENELIGHCPSCRIKWDVAFWQRHCSNCGQKLDWGR